MRALLLVVVAITLTCTACSSDVAVTGDTWTCPPGTDIPSAVEAGPGEVLLVCKPGRAVVKTASGVSSYRLAPSACFIGKTGASLYFGSYPWNRQGRKQSQILFIKIERRANSRTHADIIDGVFRLLRPKREFAVLGTALLRDGSKRGTFTIVDHVGAGVKGKAVATGQWDCGTRRTQ